MKLTSLLGAVLLTMFLQGSPVGRCAAEEASPLLSSLSSTTTSGSVTTSSSLESQQFHFFNAHLPPAKAHNQSGIEGHTQTIVHYPPPESSEDLSARRFISPVAYPIGGQSMTISVFSEDSTLVCSTWSDTEGYFKIALKPGTYQVTARPPTGGWPWSPFPNGEWIFPTVQTVVVTQKQYAPLYFEAEVFAYPVQFH